MPTSQWSVLRASGPAGEVGQWLEAVGALTAGHGYRPVEAGGPGQPPAEFPGAPCPHRRDPESVRVKTRPRLFLLLLTPLPRGHFKPTPDTMSFRPSTCQYAFLK